MHPCEEEYPCVYLRVLDANTVKCMCVHCPMSKVRMSDDPNLYVYDALRDRRTLWTTRPLPKPPDEPDIELIQRQEEYKRLMEEAHTFERRHGAVKQKRHGG